MIIEVTECVKLLLDEKEFCNYVFGIFIDVKKVFDKVDHDISLNKLENDRMGGGGGGGACKRII